MVQTSGADFLLQPVAQVGGNAFHVAGPYGFHTGLFQCVIHFAGNGVCRAAGGVQVKVVVFQPQGLCVCRTTQALCFFLIQVEGGGGEANFLPQTDRGHGHVAAMEGDIGLLPPAEGA